MHRLTTCAIASVATLCLIAGCNPSSAAKTESAAASASPERLELPDNIQITASHGPSWLGSYVSSPWAFRTNSFWIEGPEGLVIIDTQFVPSAAVATVETAESVTGKKVVAAVILHPNPDKFNGTAVLQERGIEVLTSEQVLERIPAVHELRHGWFYERYKPDYPTETPKPTSFGSATTTLALAVLELKVHVLGPGCSDAHVVVEHRGHVFVGDLVAGLGHSWLELGMLDEWHERLDEIAALEPEAVHPGRGASGGAELLTRQKAYLDQVIALVRAEKPRPDTPEEAKKAALERVARGIFDAHPGLGFPIFVEIGLPAVWDRQAAQAAAAAPQADG